MNKDKNNLEKETKSVIKKGGMYESVDISKKGLSIAIIVLSLILLIVLIVIAVRS